MLKISRRDKAYIIEVIANSLCLEELESALNLGNKVEADKVILDLRGINDWPLSDAIKTSLYNKAQFFKQKNRQIMIVTGSKKRQKELKQLDLNSFATLREALAALQ